jgi:hypothetical protein
MKPEVEPLLEDDIASGKHVAELGMGSRIWFLPGSLT